MASQTIEDLERHYEKQFGLPAGIMTSIRKQETGGNSKYVDNPSEYHYPLNAQGKRIAKHTGKESTAFGPYGILESTARDPGYGVKPLQNKTLEEQTRFAAQYLARRTKSAGGLAAGLAGYGEGTEYANQVLGRVGGKDVKTATPLPAPEVKNLAMESQNLFPDAPNYQVNLSPEVQTAQAFNGPNAWQTFVDTLNSADEGAAQPVVAATPASSGFALTDLLNLAYQQESPNMEAFQAMKGWGMI